jgi:predicted membrane-bound spermidine synthase
MVRLLLIVFALVIYIKRKYYQDTKVKQNSLYFACIAIAFMMIEIPLIQKMILFVGSPSIAFSFILFIILLSAGMGSLVSKNKIFYKKHNSKYLPLLLTGIGAIVMPYIIKLIYTNFFAFGQIQRMLIISLALSPLGFFMGMAFPYGMHIIESRGYKHHIPLVWGMNGMMSVVGSILAVTFSMAFGFNLTLTLGGLIYIVLYIKNPLFKKA